MMQQHLYLFGPLPYDDNNKDILINPPHVYTVTKMYDGIQRQLFLFSKSAHSKENIKAPCLIHMIDPFLRPAGLI